MAGQLIGLIVGIGVGMSSYMRQAVDPYITGLATAPKIIFLPIIMLFFGIGPISKIAIGALAGFFPVVLSTASAVSHIKPIFFRVAHTLNFSRWQLITKVCLPAIAQPIITGMRLGIGVTIVAVLLSEIKISNAGLGFMAMEFYNHYRIPELYALLLIIFALAALFNTLMGRLDRAFRPGRRSGPRLA